MSSNAGRTTLSLNRFVNAWGFPLLSGTTAVTMLVTYVVTFEAMKPFMDPARIDAARYAYHHIGFIPMIGVGIALAIVMRMRSVFNREVIRKTRRLASAAVTCYDKPRRNPLTAWSRITELEQLRTVLNRLFGDQFARIEELLDLTHTLKHNVNNLLQVIVIAAEEIAVKCADGTNGTCDAARRIVLCVERMKTILSVNISITENYNHLREPPRECVDVSEVLLTCADTIEPAAEEKDIRVTVNLPKEPISFSGHTQKLLNLLQNLADNAVKYTPPGGHVTISATTAEVPATPSRRGAVTAPYRCPSRARRVTANGDATLLSRRNETLILRVSDTGRGIPPDFLPLLGQRDKRAANATDQPGNGLGLAFVYSVAKLYGGEIACESTLNEGTTFTVQLPLTTKESNS